MESTELASQSASNTTQRRPSEGSGRVGGPVLRRVLMV
jgi:hypothetical protein